MDLKSLLTVPEHDAGAELQIVHPVTSEPTPVHIMLAGVDSRAFRNAVRSRNRKRAEAMARDKPEDAETEESRDIEVLVQVTLGWRGLEQDGLPLPFTPENVGRLYRDSPGIRNQVERFIYNRRNFSKG